MKVTIAGVEFDVQEAEGGLVLSKEQLDKITAAVTAKEQEAAKVTPLEVAKSAAEQKVIILEAKVFGLEARLPKDEPEIPEHLRLRLESLERERDELARNQEVERVAFTLEQARNRRTDGHGLDEATIEFAKRAMLLEGDGAIKLENSQSPDEVVRFSRNMWRKFLLEVCPASVPMAAKTEGDSETRLERLQSISDEVLKEKVNTFWN